MRLIDADVLRDAYIKKMSEIYKNVASMKNVEAETVSVLCGYSVIDEAPTVDAEPVKHGEWVKMRGMMPPEYMGLKECNKCGWHIDPLGRTAFDKRESEFRYCPRCGAKMNNQFAKGGKKVGDEDAVD